MKIEKELKHFAENLKLACKMEEYADQSAYVVLKDHKGNFKTKLIYQINSPA